MLSELLAGLDDVGVWKSKARVGSDDQKTVDGTRQMFEVQKMVRRLGIQRATMDRTRSKISQEVVVGIL